MQDDTKIKAEQFPDVGSGDLSVEDISEESANESDDEILRKVLRSDETVGNPDDRDVAGGVESADTPHGNEEIKTKIKGNDN